MITTQKELRAAFWEQSCYKFLKKAGKNQNDYPTDVRLDWVDYVEHMRYQGEISDALADRATL